MNAPEVVPYEVKDEYTITDLNQNLPKPPFRLLLIGASGTGKSQVIINMIMNPEFYWKKGEPVFKQYFIMTPTLLADPIWKALKQNKKVWDRLSLTDEFDTEAIDKILNSNDRTPKLMIIDDFASNLKRSDMTIMNAFFRSRHVNMSVILVSQSWFQVPKNIRLNASDVIIFNFGSKKERDMLEQELSTKEISGHDFSRMLQYMTAEPYTFLWRDKNMKFHQNFTPIEISD